MSNKNNKAVIGAFVLGSIGLLVAAVVIFGSGKFFSPQKKCVMYFDGSVKGLSVGAPVVFRGVKIGSVIDIILQGDMRDMTFRVPVIAEIDLNRFQITNGSLESADYQKALIDQGLRAQLQTQSLVTGQLMIDFDFHLDRPIRILTDTTGYPQIPTIPSIADELVQKLEKLPLQQLVERANSLLGGLEQLVNSPDMQNAPRTLNLTVADARTLIKRIDHEVKLLSADARGTINAATATINHANRILTFEDGAPAEVVKNFNLTLADARKVFRKFDETLGSIQGAVTDERSTYQLRHAFKDLGEASRSISALVDYLERHPESLLRGKTNLEEK
jgi:phospholipid/cholesterol/gamma-HCH transport system substrate-binding protein